MDEEGILLAAADILERRLHREGDITDPSKAASLLQARCAGLDHEVFGVVYLDTRHRILATEHLFQGTVDGCEVQPRVVAQRALQLNAAALILFHNHASWEPEPSAADWALTASIKQALRCWTSGRWITWWSAATATCRCRSGAGLDCPRRK